jgi:hypothetical protein
MRLSPLIGLLAALLLSTATVRAGEGPVAEQRIAIDFKGGTVADYLESIQEVIGVRNVMLTEGLDSIQMAPVRLSAVRYHDAVVLVRHTPVLAGRVIVETEGDTFVVWAERDTRKSVRPDTLVMSLSEMLAAELYTADEVLGAVEAVLGVDDQAEVELRYHEATSLLIARGGRDALEAIARTIADLESASKRFADRGSEADRRNEEIEALVRRNAEMRIEMESLQRTLRNEIALLEDERAQLRDQLLMSEREFAVEKAVLQSEIGTLQKALDEALAR